MLSLDKIQDILSAVYSNLQRFKRDIIPTYIDDDNAMNHAWKCCDDMQMSVNMVGDAVRHLDAQPTVGLPVITSYNKVLPDCQCSQHTAPYFVWLLSPQHDDKVLTMSRIYCANFRHMKIAGHNAREVARIEVIDE